VARVKAILRRARSDTTAKRTVWSHKDLVLDLDKRKVSLKGRAISLTVHEYNLLKALMTKPGRVFTRAELLDRLYPEGEAVIDRVIDVHIGKLRQKIEEDSSQPRHIITVRGIGYQFAEENGS
jgi:DNA-binding response OmpR family regulator